MTHNRLRGGIAWAMVIIGSVAITLYDVNAAIWISMLVIVIAFFAVLIPGSD